MLLSSIALVGLFTTSSLASAAQGSAQDGSASPSQSWCTFEASIDMRCVTGWTQPRAEFKIHTWKNEKGVAQKLAAPVRHLFPTTSRDQADIMSRCGKASIWRSGTISREFTNHTGFKAFPFHHMRFEYMGAKFEEVVDDQCTRSDEKAGWYNCKDNPPVIGPSRKVGGVQQKEGNTLLTTV
jgi:hypothetical protein